ncbi:MAG: putative ABC transporter permease [Oscillospiraceae bacterium]|nr:putative ABC transporter permease [Oscillospiraceae bacterium]
MKNVLQRIKTIMIYFICFAFIGWVYEVVLFIIEDHILVNRGVLYGPWLPVYGFGGCIIFSLFNKLKNKPIRIKKINVRPALIFVYMTLISTVVELLTTYICDLVKTDWTKLWYYGDRFMNFQGRVALVPSVRFGILGILVLYLGVPFIEKIKNSENKRVNTAVYVIIALFVIDAVIHIFTGSTYNGPV